MKITAAIILSALAFVATAPAAAPVAVDDTIFIRTKSKPVTLSPKVTANDTDADGNLLTVDSITSSPVKGKITIGTDQQGQSVLTYIPRRTFQGLDSFEYRVSDGTGGGDIGKATIVNPFAIGAGVYAGPISGNPASHGNSGYIRLAVNGEGRFTAQIRFAGESFRFSNSFEPNTALVDTFSGDLVGKIETRTLVLNFPLSQTPTAITGTINGLAFSVPRSLFSLSNQAPRKGRYTVNLAPAVGSGLPQGTGAGVMLVNYLGGAQIIARLPDGQRLATSSIFLANGDDLPIYAPLYGGGGCVVGTLNFTTQGIFQRPAGNITWQRPALKLARLFKKGFNSSFGVTGSTYTPPTQTEPDKDSRPIVVTNAILNTQFLVLGDAIRTARTERITLGPQPASGVYKFGISTPSPLKIDARINARSGNFFGKFFDPIARRFRSFNGAFIEADNRAGGLFISSRNTGKVEITGTQQAN